MQLVDQDVLQRSLDRERRARKEAESLLEEKSRALYYANQELESTAAALREEATKSSTVLQNAAEGIITFNERGIIESANPAASRIFASTSEQLVGTDVRQLVAQDIDGPEFGKNLFWTSRQDERRSCLGQRNDGTSFEMELSGSRVQLDNRLLFTWLLRDITKRRELERQLAFAQKMESVGQLAAGIAHEINTPMQYVGDNLTFLGNAFGNLATLLDLYDDLHSRSAAGDDVNETCRQIEEKKKGIKLRFLRAETPAAIEQASLGTTRVSDIVAAMKEFSHPGTQEKTCVDLNKTIESMIMISRHEWKYVADVETELDAALPQVPCFPGDLNQALLNLIVNAAHAIAERSDEKTRGKIKVTTGCNGDEVVVRVSDTGTGIPDAVREKVFEPFFTTKPIGKGTGQGLSIVYSVVVDKHGGAIDLESVLGEGTTFILRLPLNISLEHSGNGNK